MLTIRKGIAGALCVAFLGASVAATASTDRVVDFRNDSFSSHKGEQSFTSLVGDVEFKVSAHNKDGDAKLWWDATDGLGIRGGTNDDEIDSGESLTIEFANSVHISSLTFSDLFMNEAYDGGEINEAGYLVIEGESPRTEFSPESLMAIDAGNGEYRLVLDETIAVKSLTMGSSGDGSDFALRGFVDPPVDGSEVVASSASVPAPGVLALFAAGMLAMVAGARRCQKI